MTRSGTTILGGSCQDYNPAGMDLLKLILESAGEGVYGLDTEGRTTFVNPAACRLLGFSADELIGEPMHPVLHHSRPGGSHYPREECPIYAAFKDGKVYRVEDEVFWRRDGTSFPVEYTSTPILEDGKLAGAVVVFWDITARKQAEDRLKEALRQVEELKDRLQDQNLYLQEEIKTEHNFAEIIGQSPEMRAVLQQVEIVAPTDAIVLVAGETGTGKELIARAIHDLSPRRDKPLIKVNCPQHIKPRWTTEQYAPHVQKLVDRIAELEMQVEALKKTVR